MHKTQKRKRSAESWSAGVPINDGAGFTFLFTNYECDYYRKMEEMQGLKYKAWEKNYIPQRPRV